MAEEVKKVKNVIYVALKTYWYNDEAITMIKGLPDGHMILCIFLEILALAGSLNEGGYLLVKRIPVTLYNLSDLIHEDLADIERAVRVLAEMDIIELGTDSVMHVTNWDKHQAEALSSQARKESERERKANKRLEEQTKALPEPGDDAREAEIDQVISIFNEITGKNFRKSTKTTRSAINARLTEGYTVDDIRRVIQQQTDAWANNPDMCQYLCPETIFRPSKFEKYFQNLSSTSTNGEAEEAWNWALRMLRTDTDGYRAQASDRIKAAIREVGGSSWIKMHEEDAHKKFIEIY